MRTTSINRHNWLWVLVAIFMVSMVAPDFSFGRRGNETVLVANFINGNTNILLGRIHLFNPSKKAGNVTVRVFTLPVSGNPAVELPGSPLALGTLAAKSALNIRLDIDILPPLGITPPYTTDGGNLTLEFRVRAKDVTGLAQYFAPDLRFVDSYPLQVVPN